MKIDSNKFDAKMDVHDLAEQDIFVTSILK